MKEEEVAKVVAVEDIEEEVKVAERMNEEEVELETMEEVAEMVKEVAMELEKIKK